MTRPVLSYDSVTKLDARARGAVLIAGSHGGRIAAWLAERAGAHAVLLNDAGIGLEEAGIAGLDWLDSIGMAGAAIAHDSARIGDGADMARRGRISRANRAAAAAGVAPGMDAATAAALLADAPAARGALPDYAESRFVLDPGRIAVHGVDSVSLTGPEDDGQILVAGSHGALLSGDAGAALGSEPLAAAFHDAGIGIDEAGIARLGALEARRIAGVCVAAASARIGDARSLWRDGRISRLNETARALGIGAGDSLPRFAALVREHHDA